MFVRLSLLELCACFKIGFTEVNLNIMRPCIIWMTAVSPSKSINSDYPPGPTGIAMQEYWWSRRKIAQGFGTFLALQASLVFYAVCYFPPWLFSLCFTLDHIDKTCSFHLRRSGCLECRHYKTPKTNSAGRSSCVTTIHLIVIQKAAGSPDHWFRSLYLPEFLYVPFLTVCGTVHQLLLLQASQTKPLLNVHKGFQIVFYFLSGISRTLIHNNVVQRAHIYK